jgi:hypothetical protein
MKAFARVDTKASCKVILASAILAGALVISSPSRANLVTNGGFETGDFTGWTQGGNNTGAIFLTSTSSFVHSGTWAAFVGPVGSDGTLTQNIATTTGQTYEVSLWLRPDGVGPNDFGVSFGGITSLTLTNVPTGPYTRFTFDVVASSANSPCSDWDVSLGLVLAPARARLA